MSAAGWIRSTTREAIYLRDHDRCVYCGSNDLAALHLDHVLPRARGGTNAPNNLVTCCAPCNQRKHAKTLGEAFPGPENHVLRERVARHLRRPLNPVAARLRLALRAEVGAR